MMKKIGIDARFFSEKATGVGRHVYELVQHLSVLDKKNKYTIFLKPEMAKKFKPPAKNFTITPTTATHYSLAEQTTFLKQINQHHFDLMIFPQFNVPIFYRGKFVVTIHDLTLHFFPGKKKNDFLSRCVYKWIIRNAVKKAKHCFAVSANTKDDMIKILGVPGQKITITHNGISANFVRTTEKKLKNFKKKYQLPEKYFLYTGVSRSHKNILGLIRAYDLFFKKNPKSNIYLLLAGPNDPMYIPEIKAIIQDLKLKKNIQLLGLFPEKDFNQLISGAIGYIFPSFYEGFGIPPLEAMSCGVPTATSNTSSLPEVCGEATIYFDPYHAEEMAQAMEKIVFDKKLRKNLIQCGFQHSKKFSWDKMTKKMFRVYKQILDI